MKQTTCPTVAVAYIRVSKDEQELGPLAQRASIEAWCRAHGVEVESWHEDAITGSSSPEDRPGLLAALAAQQDAKAGILIVARRDRLARDVLISTTLDRLVAKHGGRIISADGAGNGDTAGDEFLRTILDAAAQYERAMIRARTKGALQAKKSKGERVGTIPLGKQLGQDGQLVPCDAELVLAARARDLHAAGQSMASIARTLSSEGHRTRSGAPLHAVAVWRLVRIK
jgi:site-specific DNA recombinase